MTCTGRSKTSTCSIFLLDLAKKSLHPWLTLTVLLFCDYQCHHSTVSVRIWWTNRPIRRFTMGSSIVFRRRSRPMASLPCGVG
jgi:hypothetical protein